MSDPRLPASPRTPSRPEDLDRPYGRSMLGAFMAVLNIQITNASLPDIQGGIGAGIDDGGWISTAYLVGEIVVIPLTGFLTRVFSLRRYLLVNAVLFLVFSVACAFAQNLPQMIVLRAIRASPAAC